MEAHCERFNLTAIEQNTTLRVTEGLGDCVKDMERTLKGLDFNGAALFTSCEDLISTWAHDDYSAYVCRNYPDSYERICRGRAHGTTTTTTM
mmetsp:Transcript_22654/g.69656  ORF Transcript_22654/g.69656 Transcript_22654/m.69656 type:complete len:92 (-) Transcript_22654:660-935(-)